MKLFADNTGTPELTFRYMEDYIDILRRMWRGEMVTYDGPVRKFTKMGLGIELEKTPPIIMAVMGDKTCEWAGRHCDGVVFNSLWTKRAVEHSSALVRKGQRKRARIPKMSKYGRFR